MAILVGVRDTLSNGLVPCVVCVQAPRTLAAIREGREVDRTVGGQVRENPLLPKRCDAVSCSQKVNQPSDSFNPGCVQLQNSEWVLSFNHCMA